MITSTHKKIPLNQGQAMMVATVFFLAISLTIIFGLIGPILRQQKVATQLWFSRQSYFLAEAGVEDVSYRLIVGKPVGSPEALTLVGNTATTITTNPLQSKEVVSTGLVNGVVRKVKSKLILGDGVVFQFGTQSGQGGFVLHNNSHINGSLYSNGDIVGSNGAYITGGAFAAGNKTISNMRVGYNGTGNAYAHNVTDSTVTGTIYCQTGSGNNKPCDTSKEDPPEEPLPISDETITQWKADAEVGGTTVGSLTVSTSTTLGPRKIIGDLTINGTLTIANTIYITGNLIININSTVKLSPSFGATSGIIIADGYIIINNGVNFQDSGTAGSYILLLSTSNCDLSILVSPCFGNNAIDVSNNSSISIVSAQKGTVYFSNNAGVKETVGYKIELKNNVGIDYGSGLINIGFSSGPSGSWGLLNWLEIE